MDGPLCAQTEHWMIAAQDNDVHGEMDSRQREQRPHYGMHKRDKEGQREGGDGSPEQSVLVPVYLPLLTRPSATNSYL